MGSHTPRANWRGLRDTWAMFATVTSSGPQRERPDGNLKGTECRRLGAVRASVGGGVR